MRDAYDLWDRIEGGPAWNAWLAQLLSACRQRLGRVLRRQAVVAVNRC